LDSGRQKNRLKLRALRSRPLHLPPTPQHTQQERRRRHQHLTPPQTPLGRPQARQLRRAPLASSAQPTAAAPAPLANTPPPTTPSVASRVPMVGLPFPVPMHALTARQASGTPALLHLACNAWRENTSHGLEAPIVSIVRQASTRTRSNMDTATPAQLANGPPARLAWPAAPTYRLLRLRLTQLLTRPYPRRHILQATRPPSRAGPQRHTQHRTPHLHALPVMLESPNMLAVSKTELTPPICR
jgi:hypothetical protein